VGVYFKHYAGLDYGEIDFGTESEARYTFYIAEEKLQGCPRITTKIGEEEVSAILDTGCELTLMHENLYEKIKQSGNNFKECHPRCVGKLDRWEGSQKHNSYDI
jgi:hypothetical protein